ncbi:MAG: sulfotransferase domain-containing protein [Pseudomonadota bacterium]|nr:sulfotransferase domain-containing protein [Pseudomonadota bacterium]
MAQRKPSYTDHKGFLMPMGFPLEAFGSALQYTARPSDIFICAYPKCGTTWLQYIVYLILHGGKALPASSSMTKEIPHLEEVGKIAVENLDSPRCIKSHLPLRMMPYHPGAAYLYVARNPFDCAVSFYHHTRGFSQHYDFVNGSFDEFFECFLSGEVDFGDYFENLVPWYKNRGRDNILFLTYEQMKAQPLEVIRSIGSFLGAEAAAVVRDREMLKDVIRNSSYDSMSRDQQRWSSQRPDNMPAFVRKGQVGDWLNYFSPDQARRLADRFDERTLGTDLKTLWPEVLRAARA